jgi:hypothetical protein
VQPEYRYTQILSQGANRDRYPAVRVRESYRQKLMTRPRGDLDRWTLDLARRLARLRYPNDAQMHENLERKPEPGQYLRPIFVERVAKLLNEHLAYSGEYTYSLEMRRHDRQRDCVMDFLVNVKQGPCDHYASALTLMLRSRGIPARIVKGFRGAEYQGEGMYVVRNNQAHSWVEALMPPPRAGASAEWLILDPTPADAELATTLERLQRGGQALWRDLILGYTAGDQAELWDRLTSSEFLGGAAPWLALMVSAGALWWWASRARSPRSKQGRPGSLYAQLLSLLDRHLRLRPRPDETPSEVAARAAQSLQEEPTTAALAGVPAQVVEVYYPMRYGDRKPDDTSLREASRQLDALARALRRA